MSVTKPDYLPVEHIGSTRLIDANELRVELIYSLGGTNMFTGKNEPRGYYLSVSPVKFENGMESFVLFSGSKFLVLECKRKSDKKQKEAERLAQPHKDMCVTHVLLKYGLKLAETVVCV